MSVRRPFVFALLPLLASCQVFTSQPTDPLAKHVRMQGELSLEAGQWLFSQCNEQRRFVLGEEHSTSIEQDSKQLLAGSSGPLFADIRGELAASKQAGVDGQLVPSRVYRLQAEGAGCDDLNFKRSTVRAAGHEPEWAVTVNAKGLLLDRPGQPAQALPYLEEQLPDGRFNLTSEANGQNLALWITPQRCVDGMSGAVQHMTAELRIDGQTMRGCAYFGGARND
jgi:putative lipoprotein